MNYRNKKKKRKAVAGEGDNSGENQQEQLEESENVQQSLSNILATEGAASSEQPIIYMDV